MRVAFYGNVCNNLYQIAKALRESAEFDAHLFLDDHADPQQWPESDDPHLAGAYPSWIHRERLLPALTSALCPWRAPLLRRLQSFDAVVLSAYGPMLAPYLRPKCYFLVTGCDLTLCPFPSRVHALSSSPVRRTVHLLRSGWQRRGIQACHELWMQPFEPFRSAADALGVPAERRRPAYLVLDTTRFQPRTVRAPWRERFDFLVFHPSRLMLAADPVLRATGDWKANGVLLAGFARFLREAPRAGLALIDRPASRDQGAARQLIRDLGIEESVVWLKPPREFGYTRAELLDLYGASDVVADDFGAGWFGSVTLEALALERPVLNFVDERAMAALYPWHPLVNAGSPLEVAAQLTRLYRDPAGRLQGAKQGRQWVEEFHSHTQVQRIYGERLLR